MTKRSIVSFSFLLVLLLGAAYFNHFHNGFHFDDSHTVTNNGFIRDIRNLPLFFKDAGTFSSLPANQSYRPVVTATLAIDYWLGGGLDPFFFHLSVFILFLGQGVLMLFLFQNIISAASAHKTISVISFFAAGWYLLHPANAETVNYVIARSDLLSAFFVVLALVMYMYSPFSRKYHLYLLPVAAGALAKIPAIMFGPLLLVYVLLFEEGVALPEVFWKKNRPRLVAALVRALPSFLLGAALYFFIQRMEPHWQPGGTSAWQYFITQPYVIFHYFKTWFLPFWLSADTDWVVFESVTDPKAVFGFIFCAGLAWTSVRSSRSLKTRPIAFGIAWFFIALVPTSSIIPLSEVMNDHRVFFPYVGLALAAGWGLWLFAERIRIPGVAFAAFCFLVLSVYGYGVHERNKVWKTDESLWKDVTEKSPGNARGLMNYGTALMARADYKGAEEYFGRALKIWPQYAYLHINMGVLKSATGNVREAEQYFMNAIANRGDLPESYYYYARFLHEQNRNAESARMLGQALRISPGHQLAADLLKVVSSQTGNGQLSKLEQTLQSVQQNPTAEGYLALSLEYYYAGRFEESIQACEEALKLRPGYDLAYNNICSAYNQLGKWDKAIEAGEKAVQLNPSNGLAKNNLEWARQQKAKTN